MKTLTVMLTTMNRADTLLLDSSFRINLFDNAVLLITLGLFDVWKAKVS